MQFKKRRCVASIKYFEKDLLHMLQLLHVQGAWKGEEAAISCCGSHVPRAPLRLHRAVTANVGEKETVLVQLHANTRAR